MCALWAVSDENGDEDEYKMLWKKSKEALAQITEKKNTALA